MSGVDQMLRIVLETIKKYNLLAPGDRVVVAVSGGPDSVALAHVLCQLKEEFKLTLHFAHLNHMFRGAEADRDARSVEELARNLGVSCTVTKENVPAFASAHRLSAQAAARQVRYNFLEQVRGSIKGTKIATGHHADDQVETILMNILRGTGPEGLSGIPPKREDIYIRPMIGVAREEIEAYCRENGLTFLQDTSNLKPVYLRNRIRLELLPQLAKDYNPGIRMSLLRLGQIMRDENGFMEAHTLELWDRLVISRTGSEVIFNLAGFLVIHPAVQRRLLRMAWTAAYGDERDLGFIHVEQILDFLQDGVTGGVIELPRHILLEKSYDCFRLTADGVEQEEVNFCYELEIPGSTFVFELGVIIEAEVAEFWPGIAGKDEIWVDFEKLGMPLMVRTRRPGDRFWPLNGAGSKKLKEFFIDEKVPRALRDKIPIVTTGEEIVWVGGIRSDDRWRITDKTRKYLHLKIKQNITEVN